MCRDVFVYHGVCAVKTEEILPQRAQRHREGKMVCVTERYVQRGMRINRRRRDEELGKRRKIFVFVPGTRELPTFP